MSRETVTSEQGLRPLRCAEKRQGMYGGDATCGDLAAGQHDGIPMCLPHLLRAERALTARLTRELEVQKAVVDLAYVPHRNLVESRDRLQARYDKLYSGLCMDAPWPLTDVLAKLVEAVEHLLRDHGCDVHGHEAYRVAIECGKACGERLREALSNG